MITTERFPFLRSDYNTSDTADLWGGVTVRLTKGAGRELKRGGLWIYDNELDPKTLPSAGRNTDNKASSVPFTDGGIVAVEDFDGWFLGYGFMNTRSTIRVRMLSRRREEPVTCALLARRVREAWNYRKQVIDTSACRVIFGEADLLPGITIDKYEDILVVESLALGIDRLKGVILAALIEVLEEDGISVRGIFERSDAKVREKEGLPRVKGFLGTPFDPKVTITENGVQYTVDVENGQKTGFFLDQKENRMAVQRLAGRLGPDAKVLDCFTHTGSFALNAALAGAYRVTAVDASDLAIAQAQQNAALNHLEDRVTFLCRDVFELLPELEKQGERYDLVVLDPPAFTKARSSTKAAARGYKEINLRGLRLVRDGGYLATCSCSHFMEEELFMSTLESAARDAHVRLRLVEKRAQAPDHPVLLPAGTSYYLKFVIVQVLR